MASATSKRSKLWLGVAALAVIVFGLASRKYPSLFPAFLGKYPGDALWALLVFLGWAFIKPEAPVGRLAVLALVTSCLVEFSQLYQAPWINAIRSTTVGHLMLGSAFSWFDLCAYTVGIAIGIGLDVLINGTACLGIGKRLSFCSSGAAQKRAVS